MSTILESVFYSKFGQSVLSAMGVKPAIELPRYDGQSPWVKGTLALATTASTELAKVLSHCQIKTQVLAPQSGTQSNTQYAGAILDATEFTRIEQLTALKDFFSQASTRFSKNAHIVILGRDPKTCSGAETAAIMEGLNGFTRSLAKELGRKAMTVNLIYMSTGITQALAAPLNFFLSHRCAYISGQPLYLNDASVMLNDINWQQPLAGKIALVTGAAQGIGAAIAHTLSRDGALVIGLDIEPSRATLEQTMQAINGLAVTTDITSEQAVTAIQTALAGRKLDIVVHNAGVTRDKTLARMPEHFWDMALNINLRAPINVTQALEQADNLATDARVICISSISGIAGNVGQTNYSASKAGVAGYVRQQAALWAASGKTINAIAPGFIETQMTAQIPFMTRELGRRMNALSQGGQPEDVAQAVSLFAQPTSGALNGQLLRVCGQSLLGA